MIEHFGLKIGDSEIGYKLTRENYARINKKSTFETGKIYDEDFCRNHAINCLINFDYNMAYFKSLNVKKFNSEIDKFLKRNPQFKPVQNLNEYKNKPGFYLMVLDDYCQAYLGGSKDVHRRIHDHWIKQKPFDRLIFVSIDTSIISIDSFRPLDTTRLYVFMIDDTYTYEDRYIGSVKSMFMCNRTIGGRLEGGLQEAIANRKERQLIGTNLESSIKIKYAEDLNPSPVQLHEIYMEVNGSHFLMNTDLDGEISNIAEWKFSGIYGTYTIVSNLVEHLVTVKEIS